MTLRTQDKHITCTSNLERIFVKHRPFNVDTTHKSQRATCCTSRANEWQASTLKRRIPQTNTSKLEHSTWLIWQLEHLRQVNIVEACSIQKLSGCWVKPTLDSNVFPCCVHFPALSLCLSFFLCLHGFESLSLSWKYQFHTNNYPWFTWNFNFMVCF